VAVQADFILPALHWPGFISRVNDLPMIGYPENYFCVVTIATECLAPRSYSSDTFTNDDETRSKKRRTEPKQEIEPMSYFLKVTEPEHGSGQLQKSYEMLQTMFQLIPKVFVAQSIRPDLLAPIVQYVNRLMVETHALPRRTKELIAAYVSKLNACAY
jgi:hypothetical protein